METSKNGMFHTEETWCEACLLMWAMSQGSFPELCDQGQVIVIFFIQWDLWRGKTLWFTALWNQCELEIKPNLSSSLIWFYCFEHFKIFFLSFSVSLKEGKVDSSHSQMIQAALSDSCAFHRQTEKVAAVQTSSTSLALVITMFLCCSNTNDTSVPPPAERVPILIIV